MFSTVPVVRNKDARETNDFYPKQIENAFLSVGNQKGYSN